jgi:hypothetical protein
MRVGMLRRSAAGEKRERSGVSARRRRTMAPSHRGTVEVPYAFTACECSRSGAGIIRNRWNGTWHWYLRRKLRNFL